MSSISRPRSSNWSGAKHGVGTASFSVRECACSPRITMPRPSCSAARKGWNCFAAGHDHGGEQWCAAWRLPCVGGRFQPVVDRYPRPDGNLRRRAHPRAQKVRLRIRADSLSCDLDLLVVRVDGCRLVYCNIGAPHRNARRRVCRSACQSVCLTVWPTARIWGLSASLLHLRGTGLTPAESAAGAVPLPHLRRDWARRCHICIGTWAHPCHICTGTWARCCHICIGTWARRCHICTGTWARQS